MIGGAAVTTGTARELRATYADGRLDVAVARTARAGDGVSSWLQAALAGAGAAAVWGLGEPIDQKAFRFPYSDIALLGKLATRGPRWRLAGWALHLVNGAIAGIVFWALYEWIGGNAFWLAIVLRWSSIWPPTR